MVTLAAFVLVLGVLIFVHEAGHFLAARLVGAPVEVFSIGFGKRLWGFELGGTDYRISMVPLGGYVRVVGLGPDESEVVGAAEAEPELLPKWKRTLILAAGPVTNLAAAVVFLAVAYLLGVAVPAFQDQPPVIGWVEPSSPADQAGLAAGDLVVSVDGLATPTWRDLEMSILTSGGHDLNVVADRNGTRLEVVMTPTKVTRWNLGYSGMAHQVAPVAASVQRGSPADRAGIEAGDRIVAINGEAVGHFYDLYRLISPHPGQEITLSIERGPETFEVSLVPEDDGGVGRIGVGAPEVMTTRKLGFVAAVRTGFTDSWRLTIETFRVLRKLVTGRTSIRQVSGPIEIARISGEAARSGLNRLVWLMGVISLQLGIFNLLPIPLLDGGHLTIIGFEAAIRRDLSMRVKERILEVGFYLLIALMVVVLFNDVIKNVPESLYDKLHQLVS